MFAHGEARCGHACVAELPHLETVNFLHFRKNNNEGYSTNLSLHSRDVAGEARGLPRLVEPADRGVLVAHLPTAFVFLDVIHGARSSFAASGDIMLEA